MDQTDAVGDVIVYRESEEGLVEGGITGRRVETAAPGRWNSGLLWEPSGTELLDDAMHDL